MQHISDMLKSRNRCWDRPYKRLLQKTKCGDSTVQCFTHILLPTYFTLLRILLELQYDTLRSIVPGTWYCIHDTVSWFLRLRIFNLRQMMM